MPRAPYSWADGRPAIIQQHSVAKHEVLREYLVAYLQTLVASPAQDVLSVTLVDGFAGGGVYTHERTGEVVLGSPFVFLEAAKVAEALITFGRQKPLQLRLDYMCVERDLDACRSLERTLVSQGYGARVGRDIHVLNSAFEHEIESILTFIQRKSPRKGRSIFLLDQYGYSEVPASRIRSIFATLPRAEVILTFNVDAFINYASDSAATRKKLREMDMPDVLRGRTFEDIKRNEKDFRLYIQSCLYRELVARCGARYFTVFFIRTTGHGDYWLVHLSQHPRARDVMTGVHWNKNNYFIHYGGAGLDMFRMLGYRADHDSAFTGQNTLGFCFDDVAGEASVAALVDQLAPLVHERPEGVAFGDLFAAICNTSPADSAKYRQALERLVAHKEITVTSPAGAQRFRASSIGDRDLLAPASQRTFSFL